MTGQEIAVRTAGPPAPAEWDTYKEMASMFVNTEFVPKSLRGKPEATLAAIVSGHELGIGPMQALKHIAIIDGRPAPSAELMVALVRGAGHSIQGETSDTKAVVKGKRHDNGDEFTVTWTIDQAQKASLDRKDNWRKYPSAMLWNRAVSQLCRALFADVIAGMGQTPEELGAEVDEHGEVIEAEVVEKPVAGSPLPEWVLALSREHTDPEIIGPADQIRIEKGHKHQITSLVDVGEKFKSVEAIAELKRRIAFPDQDQEPDPQQPSEGVGDMSPNAAGQQSPAEDGAPTSNEASPPPPETSGAQEGSSSAAPSSSASQQELGGADDEVARGAESSTPTEDQVPDLDWADILEQALAAGITVSGRKLKMETIIGRATQIATKFKLPIPEGGFDSVESLGPEIQQRVVLHWDLHEKVGALA